jgi:hypothetical protein
LEKYFGLEEKTIAIRGKRNDFLAQLTKKYHGRRSKQIQRQRGWKILRG